jgi:hypothetical protein
MSKTPLSWIGQTGGYGMPTSAQRLATDLLRIAVENFDAEVPTSVAETIKGLGLNLTDMANALATCEATGSNKLEADGAIFYVRGATTEDMILAIEVWVSMDQALYRVLDVSLVGEGR